MKVIGTIGKKRHGKDAVCRIIQKYAPENIKVERFAFADELKLEVAAACGVTVETIDAEKELFRTILQWWGTEFRRQRYGDGYWVDKLRAKLSASRCDVAVITDVRFPNEAELVRQFDGTLLRVRRLNFIQTEDGHCTETLMDDYPCDHTIEAYDLRELELKVKELDSATIRAASPGTPPRPKPLPSQSPSTPA